MNEYTDNTEAGTSNLGLISLLLFGLLNHGFLFSMLRQNQTFDKNVLIYQNHFYLLELVHQ